MSFSIFQISRQWLLEQNLPHNALESSTSTNDLAKSTVLSQSHDLHIYLTDSQSQGRGRGQNTWLNPQSGSALMTSWAFRMSAPPQPLSGPVFGLAVYRALRATFSALDLSIKAPNDIYLGPKKVAGLLLETVQQGPRIGLIVGLGLNVFATPAELETAGHLSNHEVVTPEKWQQFLTELRRELNQAQGAAIQNHLSDRDRDELLAALNRFEGLAHKYDSVSPLGDLHQGEHVISWRQL